MPTRALECPFCRVAAHIDETDREVYRDQRTVAFFPKAPATPGHTLVIPDRHVSHVWELDHETATALGDTVVRLAAVIRRATGVEGLSVIQSNGPAAGQTVDHLHVHLVPRRNDDRFGQFWPTQTSLTEDELNAAWRQVRTETERVLAASPDPPVRVDPEDRRKHLDYIQAVITRMSAASSTAKGWLLPVVTATYGYALTQGTWSVAALGLAAVAIFALMDANYLRQEKAYRRLYDVVAKGERAVPPFTLDPSHANESIQPKERWWRTMARRVRCWIPGREVWASWSIAPFYGGLLLAGIVVCFAASRMV